MCDSLRPHGLYSPWNSLGQNTGVGNFSLLRGIFPTQQLNWGVLHCRQILYQLSYQGILPSTIWVRTAGKRFFCCQVTNSLSHWCLRRMLSAEEAVLWSVQSREGFIPCLFYLFLHVTLTWRCLVLCLNRQLEIKIMCNFLKRSVSFQNHRCTESIFIMQAFHLSGAKDDLLK